MANSAAVCVVTAEREPEARTRLGENRPELRRSLILDKLLSTAASVVRVPSPQPGAGALDELEQLADEDDEVELTLEHGSSAIDIQRLHRLLASLNEIFNKIVMEISIASQ